MKKVCIDARMLNSGGIGTYLKSLLKNLKTKKFKDKKVKIFLIVNSKIQKKEKWLFKNFELIVLDAAIYSIKEQLFLPFKVPKCDLFFSPHFNIPALPIRAKKRLVTIHDVYHLAFFSKLKILEKIYAKYFICKAVLQSDKIITVSNFSKSEILKYTKIKPDKIEVIYNAVENLKNFEKDQIKKMEKSFKKLNLPKKYFLFVGNFKNHKNLLNLIKAFEMIEKKFKDIFLIVVGKNKNIKNFCDIEKFLDKNSVLTKKVKIISDASDDELLIIYKKAIALVFPSFYEGFGYPPLEAMKMKCPVIASNIGSISEICKDAVLYINPYDYKSIFHAMKKIIEDKNYRFLLIKKGIKRIIFFQSEDFINKHIYQMEKLL